MRAINRHDVDAIAGLVSDEHRFVDSLGGTLAGREKIRAAWAAYFRMVPDYAIAVEESYGNDSVVVMLGIAQGTYTADGRLRPENRWSTPAALRAFIEDSRVMEWRVYADNEPIRQVIRKIA